MPARTCPLCPVYRPDGDPRPVAAGACGADLWRLDHDLYQLPGLITRLQARQDACADTRLAVNLQRRYADPVASSLPSGGVAARPLGPRVAGTPEPTVPVNLDAIDLSAPARPAVVRDEYGDQVGYVSVASTLHSWAQDWQARHFPDTPLPAPTVQALAWWLRAGLHVVLDRDEALAELAAEVKAAVVAAKRLLDEGPDLPRVLWGVPCPKCSAPALTRPAGGDYIECAACPAMLSEAEYQQWVAQKLAENAK